MRRLFFTTWVLMMTTLPPAAPATAADMTVHPPVISAESVTPDETGGGWYLRGDIGYSLDIAPTLSWQQTSYTNRRAADVGTFDVGLGYRFTDNLRSDVTLDFLTNRSLKGYLNSTDDDRLTQDTAALLINGYYDIGTWSRITPYIGGGIGLARVNTGSLTRELSGAPTYTFAGSINYVLAASAMTGLSFDIGHGLQADIGYKFTWIDRTRTGYETTGALTGPVTIGDTSAHQFRVGLKYFIN